MPRKQVGAIDEGLLAEVDRVAEQLGQTRRVFVERALRARLGMDGQPHGGGTISDVEVSAPIMPPANRAEVFRRATQRRGTR